MGSGRIGALLALAVAAVGLPCFAAQKTAPDGVVHRVEAEIWTGSGRPTTALRHVRQAPTGGRSSLLILGTEDTAIDRDPALAVDPVDGSILLVWVRDDGSGSKLRATCWKNGSWATPVTLSGPSPIALEPQIRVGAKHVHVVWSESSSMGTTFWRGVYAKAGFERLFGPEPLPTDDVPLSAGESPAPGSGESPSPDDLFVSVLAPGKIPGDPGRIHTWGMRDEPVPIGYRQAHGIPGGASSLRRLGCGWVGPRFAVWFDSNAGFHYRVLEASGWQGFRLVELDSDVTHGDARLLVEETLRR